MVGKAKTKAMKKKSKKSKAAPKKSVVKKAASTKKKPAAKKKPVAKKKVVAKKKPKAKTTKTTASKAGKSRKKVNKTVKSAVKKKPVAKKKTATASKTPPAKIVAKPKPKKKPSMTPAARKAAYRKQFGPFRVLLIEKHQSLVQSYAKAQGGSRGRSDDGTEDYIDYAVSSYARDFSLSLNEMDHDRIRLVEEALKRYDNWHFGSCLACNKAIPLKRLEVESWARYCIPCQELDDRGLLEPRDSTDDDDDVLGVGDEIVPGDEDLSDNDS
jgi:RNA polymerase-binding transcription factor DksA